ncbi:sensor histidine kinase [Anaeroselena agilis]|uniref:histidine kinase n=1 Tax=Anaeroselena agilis TaxID=3063788 RepID=A0ABU3NSA3_9FIRM|nr:histidine kinase [Selenomonadales bacterium 4137-cl]
MLTGFDMRTLIAVLVVGHVVSLALLLADFNYGRTQAGERLFVLGRLSQLVGLVLVGLRGEISGVMSLLLGNSLVMTGQAMESMAWVSLKNTMTRKWWLFYGLSLAVIMACIWNVPFALSRTVRMSVPMVLQSAFLLIPGLQLAFSRTGSSPTQKVIGSLYIVGFLAALWRHQYIMGLDRYRLFMTDLPHSAFFVVLIFLLVAGSQGYILIKKEVLNKELEESNRNLQREKEAAAFYEAELRKHQVERAELKALQAQIKPHFLQNTLGAIGHFCRVDSAKAQQLLRDLAAYLRGTFELTADCVPLAEEMKVVRAYLDIESVRLGPRLDVRCELEGDLSVCMIPPFTLQPLVENAVRHGIAPRREGGVIRISIRETDDGFVVAVEDDGVGMPGDLLHHFSSGSFETRRDGLGLGLFSVDRRLRSMFGEGLKVVGAGGLGTRVSFFVPRRANCRMEGTGSNA